MLPQIAYVIVTTTVGWLALWPARRYLGRTGYHVAAFPVGLLGWGFVAIVSLSLKTGYSWPLAIISLALFCAGVAALARRAATTTPDSAPDDHSPWWGYAITATVLVAATALVSWWGVSAFSHDSWAQYELYSWLLFDSGMASAIMVGHRMLMPTAFHAAYHLFGGEWAGFIYPIISLHVATLVGLAAYRAARPARRTFAVAAALSIVVAMVTHVTYLFMSIYVHSHMPTAIYLLLAGYGLWRASEHLGEATHNDPGTRLLSRPWLLVAGLGVAGIWLSRPDGPAYAMSAVLLFGAILLTTGARRRDSYVFFAPGLILSAAYTISTIINRGWWTSPKIDSYTLVAFIALYVAIWLIMWRLPLNRLGWLTEGHNFMRLVLAAEALGLVWAFRVVGEQAIRTLNNAMLNLLQDGGWRSFWPMMVAMVVVSVALHVRSGRIPFTTNALFYAVQFIVIALYVHEFTHPGRIGWGDSLSRVAFHAVPLLYLYLSLYVGGLLRAVGIPKTTGGDR